MSNRYDLENSIARWCAKKELPQEDVVELVLDVLGITGQTSLHMDSTETEEQEERNRVAESVSGIYARTLGY